MLILERPWTRQPQAAVNLDKHSSIALLNVLSWNATRPAHAEKKGDFTGIPYNLTQAASIAGKYGPVVAQSFNGTNSYVSLGDPTPTNIGTGSIAFEVLFRTTSVVTPQMLIAKDSDITNGREYLLSINEESRNGHVRLVLFSGNNAYFILETPIAAITANTWHHLFACRAANTTNEGLSIFVDGVYQTRTNAANAGSPTATVQNGGTEARIGSRTYTGNFNYFSGDIAFARIYTNTPADCTAIAKALADNPWQLFAPQQIIIPTPAAAASAPTITALSAIGITATSAQPRITYA